MELQVLEAKYLHLNPALALTSSVTLGKLSIVELPAPQLDWIIVRITWDTSWKVKGRCLAESQPLDSISYGGRLSSSCHLLGIFWHWRYNAEQESHFLPVWSSQSSERHRCSRIMKLMMCWVILVPFVIYRALFKSCCNVSSSLVLIFYKCVTSMRIFCIRSLASGAQSSQPWEASGPQHHASSHLCVASRTELAEVLLLRRKQPTRRAERKLWLGKIHKAARLGHWRDSSHSHNRPVGRGHSRNQMLSYR